MHRLPKAVGALAIAGLLAVSAYATAGPAQAEPAGAGPLVVAAMSPIPGLSGGSLVTPTQQCRYASYCSYGRCYQRRQCYVCWTNYGRQYCEWRWY